MTLPTQDELDQLCRKWQRRLRLTDWQIAVQLTPARDMPEHAGTCTAYAPERQAVICLSDHADNPYSRLSMAHPESLEFVLVHELLEIHFEPFKVDQSKSPHKHLAQEQAINMIAAALMGLDAKVGPLQFQDNAAMAACTLLKTVREASDDPHNGLPETLSHHIPAD